MAGSLDVDAVLDAITPEQFDEWIAYRQIESDPFERLMAAVKTIGLYVVTALGGKEVRFEDLDPLGPQNDQEKTSPKQWRAMLAARAGATDGDRCR